jgi:hypothetical protein
VIPTNITIVSPPMTASVVAALRALGFLKLGTPLLTASTPVSAVHPDAKARSTSPTSSSPVTWCSASIPMGADSATGVSPTKVRVRPTPIMVRTHSTKPYVGIANTVPDSLVPRRFIRARPTTRATAIVTACGARLGTAETMFETPAATETATVST